MIQEEIKLRIRYAETDQMGFVYYGNYAQYLELGRVAAMKKAGVSYRELELDGIGLPVKDMQIEYFKAATYDDEITIVTTLEKMPSNRIFFHYQLYREDDLLVKASTTLFFMDKKSLRPIKMPEWVENQLKPFFS